MTTTRETAAEARGLPREPTARWILVLVAVVSVVWLAVAVWQWMVLPDRVAIHFGPGGEPDDWTSRVGAVSLTLVLPLLVVFPMPLLSLLAIHWPQSINSPHRDYWIATPWRLRRFERLLREDLWLIAVATLALLVLIDVSIVMAARSGDGLPQTMLWGPLIAFLVVIGVVTARILGSRYAPPSEPEE